MRKYSIYIVLTRTNSVLSNVIKLITKDKYTHAAISLDKDLNQMYGFSRKYTYNPFKGVFKKEDVNEGLYKHQKIVKGTVMEIKVNEEQYIKFRSLLEGFIVNKYRYKYNIKGLIYAGFNKEIKVENKFFCSEFIYYLLRECEIINWNIAPNLVKPQQLLNIQGKRIYEGDLKKMNADESTNYSLNYNQFTKC